MKIGWILGWGVPESWFASRARQAFREADHRFVVPTPGLAEVIARMDAPDLLVGYSLGACLLVESAATLPARPRKALLAPMFSLAAAGAGSARISPPQVRYLQRWLRQDRAAAMADFHRRAGLDVAPGESDDLADEDLAWGLGKLVEPAPAPAVPPDWTVLCGDGDALIDGRRLQGTIAHVEVVRGAGHDPLPLIETLALRMGAAGRAPR